MNQPETGDAVEKLLREQNQYVNDDGFTARVVAALPRRRRSWLRQIVLLGAAAIGSILAVQWLPWGSLLSLDSSALLSLSFQVLVPWMTMTVVVISIAWAVVAALQWDE
ncbi:MAG TPA: DUF5056 domain-containing protein [Verrucomicrobiae bacterium]|nr:DUF5056 domain-containing protein [Verrucomicrobiae bacterium]